VKCGSCGHPIVKAIVAYRPAFKHVMGGHFCYQIGSERAAPYLIEEQP
jgi:hypothetical protein